MRLPSIRLAGVLGALAVCGLLTAVRVAAEDAGLPTSTEPAAPAASTAKEIKEVAEALELFKKLDFDGCLAKLREAVKAHPELPPPQLIMAEFFARAQQVQAMRRCLELAVNETPADPEPYIALGEVALREGQVTDASLEFEKANSLMGAFQNAERKKNLEPRIHSGQSVVATSRGNWDAAQKQIEAWLKLEPKNATAMQRLAGVLFKLKKTNEAKDQLKAAYDINPKSVHWGAIFAYLYEQAEDHKQAKTWMDFAVKSAPKDLATALSAAQWALETGELDQAKSLSATAMQIDPKSLEAKILRGIVALFQKQYLDAETYFLAAVTDAPGNFAASNNLALALCEQDDAAKKKRALQYADQNLRANSKSLEAASTYGWVLYKAGNLQQADEILSNLARAGRVSEDTAYYIAAVAAERGRKDDAKALLEQALKSKRPFSKRQEAQTLLDQLKK